MFAADVDQYRGTRPPRQSWEVGMVKQSGDRSASAYLLSQEQLIADGFSRGL